MQRVQDFFSNDIFSVAPMLDYTDRHFRYFIRLITLNAVLYTELTTAQAVVLGDRKRFIEHLFVEEPLVLQLGGNEVALMKKAAEIASETGFYAININTGCPSARVQSGSFGAVLMKTPLVVADCVAEMKAVCAIPITVKTRISLSTAAGDGFQELCRFVEIIKQAGCQHFIVHARKAHLNKSPKDNRGKLPLNYNAVYQLKKEFPDLFISINGNITADSVDNHFPNVDGVMVGRAVYGNPYSFRFIDQKLYHNEHPVLSRVQILEKMLEYTANQPDNPKNIFRHLLGLFHSTPLAGQYKQMLMQGDINLVYEWLSSVPALATLD